MTTEDGWRTRTIGAAGTELVLAWREGVLPVVAHWGRALGADAAAGAALGVLPGVLHSSFDAPRTVSILPGQHEGWSGTPAVEVRGGAPLRLALDEVAGDAGSARVALSDPERGVRVTVELAFDDHGVLRHRLALENTGDEPLEGLALRSMLPLPAEAEERLDLTGRWSGERRPQRAPVVDGVQARAARRGRSGHDAPLLETVGTAGFGFRAGEVWGVHVAWSGDAEYLLQRLPEGAGTASSMLSGAELLDPAEIVLAAGERYDAPEALFVWSDLGIDGLSDRLHAHVRAFPAHPSRPRPVVLNTWEAVYFEHDLGALVELAEVAAEVGVERFVLDDGWMVDRRNDHHGLGEWLVDGTVWPEGLRPLAERVRALGMEFGLWFEPEMVNPSSRTAREHPEWLLVPPAGLGRAWRHEHPLDLAHPDAFAFLLERMSAVIRDAGVAYVKWDHNRDLHEPFDRRTGRPGVHAQTRAVYALMDELRARHPGLEIESCASGGARVDLGVLAHAQRIWASDTNDAIERQRIQRWTGVLVPPELVGSHVGPERAHTTGRRLDLSFRLVTALFGHAGIEWDIRSCSAEEREVLRRWTACYRDWRDVIATGRTVRADHVREGALLHGVVAPDGGRALFAWVQLESSPSATTERVRIPGIDEERSYDVRLREDLGPVSRRSVVEPGWIRLPAPVRLSGAVLANPGLPMPALDPAQAVLLELTAV